MRNNLIILELFGGICGFSKGLEEGGLIFKKIYYSEIDKHCIAISKYNYGERIENIGSITDVRGNRIEHPDIITFGSPCQDFSLAGNRLGMEGKRSVLILEAIRIIKECKPSIFIWENVKGTFSSNNGCDFWAIISAFANIGDYRLEWQLLNTNWFLPQNRERIYLIGHLAGASEPRIFPIGESNERNIEKIKKQKTEFTIINGERKIGSGWLPSSFRMIKSDKMETLTATALHAINVNGWIRNLTEIEYERLQGFKDDWTRFGNYDGEIKQVSKSNRYRLLGNAVSPVILREIGKSLNHLMDGRKK